MSQQNTSLVVHSNYQEKQAATLAMMSKDRGSLGFNDFKSCLAVGPGAGLNELEFIKQMMPNLKTFTAVEPDATFAAELRLNLQRLLPNVDGIVHDKTIQEFLRNSGTTNKLSSVSFDVVLFFHVLYYIDEVDRRNLFQTLFGLLRSDGGGKVVLHHRSGSEHPEYFYRIADLLGPNRVIPSKDDLVKELIGAGFQVERQYEYQYGQDLSSTDDKLLAFFCELIDKQVTMTEFRTAMRQIWPDEKTDNSFSAFVMFRQ